MSPRCFISIRIAISMVATALLSACAGPSTVSTAMLPGTHAVTAQAAQAAVIPGRSSKADVQAALGKTTAVRFDSGYEVWVYRWEGAGAQSKDGPGRAQGADEYVVLFDPSGIATKARVRMAPRDSRPGT